VEATIVTDGRMVAGAMAWDGNAVMAPAVAMDNATMAAVYPGTKQ